MQPIWWVRQRDRERRLILLPELMPSGYLLTEEIWDCAEPFNGRTVSWLTGLAKQMGISVGTSFLEAEGEDFYNTFVLAVPGGQIAGRVRKSPPASLEACFYRAGEGSHVIETDLGRIGVGICYENLLYERLVGLYAEGVDLVLQPAAAGRPKPMKPGDIKLFDRMVARFAPSYRRAPSVYRSFFPTARGRSTLRCQSSMESSIVTSPAFRRSSIQTDR